jgi:hypothetical protein
VTGLPHAWRRDSSSGDGIDWFWLDSDLHNGPGCSRCYESFCEHCEEDRAAAIRDGSYEEQFGGCSVRIDMGDST